VLKIRHLRQARNRYASLYETPNVNELSDI
jgi:hypothetical protein